MAECLGEELGCRIVRGVSPSTWRVNFIGSQKRGTKRATLKDLTKERCRQLGMKPQNDDEADAIGILTHAAESLGLSPPWTANEVLRPPLGSVGACKPLPASLASAPPSLAGRSSNACGTRSATPPPPPS